MIKSRFSFFTGFFIAFSLMTFLTAGSLYEDEEESLKELPPVEVIVCLAGGKGRIESASDLWFRYYQKNKELAPDLFLSGVGPFSTPKTVRAQMKKEVSEALPAEKLIIETQSTNTDENARFFVAFKDHFDWESVLLVTASYHLKRSRLIFERVLGDSVLIAGFSVDRTPYNKKDWSKSFNGVRVTISEYWKWIFYRFVWNNF